MQFPSLDFLRAGMLALCALAILLPAAPLHAQPLELTLTPTGRNASGRPLPVGATPGLTIAVRNSGAEALGPVELTVRLDGLAAEKAEDWRIEDGALRTALKSIAAGATAERLLRLRVGTAPFAASSARVSVEAKGPGGSAAAGEAELRVADCAGAYRARLATLRENLAQPVRDAADEMRRSDPALPAARQFPPAGKRGSELARVEQLAAKFAARRGADPQLATEWFRFLLQRWASELNAYAGQAANPGLCANNYYQIAGYRQGLLPITKHIDATRLAAEKALELARKEAGREAGGIDEIVGALLQSAKIEAPANGTSALAALAGLRDGRRLEPELVQKLSVAETAAWLAETDRRGQKLVQAIEQVLATIATAHKETCVCAF